MKRRNPQTETPAFKRWFGKSVVADESGVPLVVYHGTGKAFDTFDPARLGEQTGAGNTAMGFFFAEDYDLARELYAGKRGEVMEVYLSIQKPLRIRDAWDNDMGAALRIAARDYLDRDPETAEDWWAFRNYLRDLRGIDGVEFVGYAGDPKYEQRVYLAFEPTQIKSATGNRGTFAPEDPNIMHNPRRRAAPRRALRFVRPPRRVVRRNGLARAIYATPPTPAVAAFMAEWNKRDMDTVFADMGVRVDVLVSGGDYIELELIEARIHKQGAGSRALRVLLDLVDKHHLGVTLNAMPFSSDAKRPPSLDDLVRLYQRFGFRLDEDEDEDEEPESYAMYRPRR